MPNHDIKGLLVVAVGLLVILGLGHLAQQENPTNNEPEELPLVAESPYREFLDTEARASKDLVDLFGQKRGAGLWSEELHQLQHRLQGHPLLDARTSPDQTLNLEALLSAERPWPNYTFDLLDAGHNDFHNTLRDQQFRARESFSYTSPDGTLQINVNPESQRQPLDSLFAPPDSLETN